MKREKLEWLATPPKFTQRFEDEIGYGLRDTPISTVADLLDPSWDQGKRIEMAYMNRFLDATPIETPRVIGVDEIAVKKRRQYPHLLPTEKPEEPKKDSDAPRSLSAFRCVEGCR